MAEHPGAGLEKKAYVPRSVFSVSALPQHERFDAWKESIASIFDVEAEKDVASDFRATIEAHLIGPLLFARTETLRQSWTRSSRRMALDGMDHYLIQYFPRGGHTDLDPTVTGNPNGYIVVFDLSRPIANATSDFRNLSLLIPRALLAERLERPDEMHNRIVGGVVGDLLRTHLLTLEHHAQTLEADSADRVADVALGIASACLNGIETGDVLRDGAAPYAAIMKIKRFIDAHLHREDLTAALIARQNGVSRSKLSAMFEHHGGVATYVRAQRLQRAFQRLRDPGYRYRSLYEIALETGYNNDAAFCRAFKNHFDITPGEARRMRRPRQKRHASHLGSGRHYEDWLHNLGAAA